MIGQHVDAKGEIEIATFDDWELETVNERPTTRVRALSWVGVVACAVAVGAAIVTSVVL